MGTLIDHLATDRIRGGRLSSPTRSGRSRRHRAWRSSRCSRAERPPSRERRSSGRAPPSRRRAPRWRSATGCCPSARPPVGGLLPVPGAQVEAVAVARAVQGAARVPLHDPVPVAAWSSWANSSIVRTYQKSYCGPIQKRLVDRRRARGQVLGALAEGLLPVCIADDPVSEDHRPVHVGHRHGGEGRVVVHRRTAPRRGRVNALSPAASSLAASSGLALSAR